MTEREKSIVYDGLLDQARKAGFETLAEAVAKACRDSKDIDATLRGQS